MNITDYEEYISEETMMGPNSVRILAELFDKCPLRLCLDDTVLDLGCGTGLTSLIIAKETGAKVFANDLWISAEENGRRFAKWNVGGQITPICEDANNLHFEKNQFSALISIDSYHYFAGSEEFFQEKILPFMKDNGVVLIGIPGLKDEYAGCAKELLSDWLGDDAYMFKNPKLWKELIGDNDRIESVTTWEMDCFNRAWEDWLATNNKFALEDKQHFETIIKPYTCFVGIYIKLKKAIKTRCKGKNTEIKEGKKENYMSMGRSLGVCFGVGVGALVGSMIESIGIGIGMCFGISIGMFLGMAIGSAIKKDNSNNVK